MQCAFFYTSMPPVSARIDSQYQTRSPPTDAKSRISVACRQTHALLDLTSLCPRTKRRVHRAGEFPSSSPLRDTHRYIREPE